MFAYDEQGVIGSKGVTLINQLGTLQRTHQLIIQPLFFKSAASHLFTHLGDAAV